MNKILKISLLITGISLSGCAASKSHPKDVKSEIEDIVLEEKGEQVNANVFLNAFNEALSKNKVSTEKALNSALKHERYHTSHGEAVFENNILDSQNDDVVEIEEQIIDINNQIVSINGFEKRTSTSHYPDVEYDHIEEKRTNCAYRITDGTVFYVDYQNYSQTSQKDKDATTFIDTYSVNLYRLFYTYHIFYSENSKDDYKYYINGNTFTIDVLEKGIEEIFDDEKIATKRTNEDQITYQVSLEIDKCILICKEARVETTEIFIDNSWNYHNSSGKYKSGTICTDSGINDEKYTITF